MTEQVFTEVPAPELLERVRSFKAQGWRFVQCCATRIGEGLFELLYTFCDDATNEVANLRVRAASVDEVPSVGTIYPCAFMFENEMHDLFGIDVVGVTLDYDGNVYHLHIPTPMAHASERAKKAAAKAAE